MEKIIDVKLYDGSLARLECHDTLYSTSDLAKQYAKAGYPDRYVVIAESERQRGSDKKGLYMSLILRPSFSLLKHLSSPLLLPLLLLQRCVSILPKGWV